MTIAVTGIGMVSAVGATEKAAWSAMQEGRGGLSKLSLFNSPQCGHYPVGEVNVDVAARSKLDHGSRSDHLAVLAARAAFEDAGLAALSLKEIKAAGLVLGASTGGMLDTEIYLRKLLKENKAQIGLLRHHECASTTEAVSRTLNLSGYRSTLSTACSSGAMAVASACDLLEAGECRIVLAGGVDSLTRLTLNGFVSLLVMDPEGCRPFDANRRGMSLGEGAGILVLETEENARSRGAGIKALIAGRAATCDAYHSTAPAPDGEGIFRAMSLALKNAGMSPGDVGYINAHGTGTVDNDRAESKAIERLFKDRIPMVSSTKRFFGHTLGAAGAIEAVLCVLCLEHQQVPGNLGLRESDPQLGFEPVKEMTKTELYVVLSNSLGFGGNNCSLVFRAP